MDQPDFQGELFLHGLGHFHPENVIDNAFLASLGIETDDQWIMDRVGIRTRRTILPLDYIRETKNSNPLEAKSVALYTNAKTAAKAAQMALTRAGLELKDIGMVVAGCCSPDNSIPAEACVIAAELGLNVPAFDLNSACSSFAVQLHNLRAMRPEALPDYVLVVNAENNTKIVDYSDRRTAVLWGDCTTAAIVSTRKPSRFAVTYSTIASDPSGWDKVVIPTGGKFSQNGHAVQTFAIRKSIATLSLLRGKARDPAKLFFIGHQANRTMLNSICERAEVPTDRHLFSVDEFGNCGAAGAPSTFSLNWNAFKKGDEIGLVVVGSGLTWGGLLFDVRGDQ
ncbi:MAG: 3-oxoacyl-ACP synthase III family protein [Bdellovibrionota bacterium]